jgi:glycosyltransferase involved in cell wall biosynthesis
MRIAWVVPGGVDESGRERVVPCWLSLLSRLAQRHEVVVFSAAFDATPRTYPFLGATVVNLGRSSAPRGLRFQGQYRVLAPLVAERGPFDLFHGFWGVPGGLLAAISARRSGAPSLVTFDSGELVACPDIGYGLQGHWPGRLQVALTARLASRVVVCTEYMRLLAEQRGIDAALAPFGADVSPPTPNPRRSDGSPWRLLHVASLNRVKDQPTLLNAFRRIVARVPDTHLDIVGEDTLDGTMQALAQRLGIGPYVTFHGFQPLERVHDFYARAHLLLQSSRHEAAGMTVVEAAMAGVPTVGTRVGHVADWSPDAAVAVPVRDDTALADAVTALLLNPPLRERLARAAHNRAAALNGDDTTERYEQLYQEIAGSRGSARSGSSHSDRSR